jgi:putative flippase GtrA
MPIYQTSKQITKFIISGVLAVMVDFLVYFTISQFLEINISKGIGFCSGMVVTYNLNKYWTWRQKDKNNKRLLLFSGLYLIAMLVNIFVNQYAFNQIPNTETVLSIRNTSKNLIDFFAIKNNKVFAFVIATGMSAALTFLGQKFWLFRVKD